MPVRPRWMATLASTIALTLAAFATSLTVAPTASASRTPAPGATAYGNDISWPQCLSSQGGYGLPGPSARAKYAVIGLTDGGSFRANPCLAGQVASAKARHLWAGAYSITTYPTRAQLARYGGTGPLSVRLHQVGAAQARFNLATMARVGLRPPMVWVDVEPNARTGWSVNVTANNAVIDGVIAGYMASGLSVGIYSYAKGWNEITGGRILPTMPTWVPVGQSSRAAAASRCTVPSFSGRRPWLTQWTDGVRDYNITCPGVTGRAARGNLLTPQLNVPLAYGSRGGSVVVLQRHLGGLKVDGKFGPLTRARVVAFQRGRHQTPNGVVGQAVWRALGAGTGTYTPAVRGFTNAIFAST